MLQSFRLKSLSYFFLFKKIKILLIVGTLIPLALGSTCYSCNPCSDAKFDPSTATQVQCSGLCMKVFFVCLFIYSDQAQTL